MKRFLVSILLGLIMMMSVGNVHATAFSEFLPGGKNYLDVDNFNIGSSRMETIDDIRIRPNTDYTFSVAPQGLLDNPYLRIDTNTGVLISGYFDQLPNCQMDIERSYCTFTTAADTMISIAFEADGLGQYVGYYEFENIQLEEGSSWSSYEPYETGYADINSPQFEGVATFVKAYYETIYVADIIADHILALDDIDGDITSSIQVMSDNYTENMYQAGQYQVDLQAQDSSGNIASMSLSIIVKDEIAPLINGPEVVVVSVDQPPSLTELLTNHYTAMDGHDGSLELTVLSEQYSSNKHILGTYSITLYTEDAHLNSVSRTVSIRVEDETQPTLVSSPIQTVLLSNPTSLNQLIQNLDVTDNYDDPSLVTINVLNENYSTNQNLPGQYLVEIELSDTSGNTIEELLEITVVDDVSPNISGPFSLTVSYQSAPTIEELVGQLHVSDNVDSIIHEDITITQDDYSSRMEPTGIFNITFGVEDSSGNQSTHTMQITVIDDQAPTIYIDNYLITVTNEATFTPTDALNMMIANKELEEDNYLIETVHDNYTENQGTSGMYNYTLRFINTEGKATEKEFMIRVMEVEEDSNTPWPDALRYISVYTAIILVTIYVILRSKK